MRQEEAAGDDVRSEYRNKQFVSQFWAINDCCQPKSGSIYAFIL
jgi:hypothetical protein